jgi:triosephosphate isomerase
MRRKLAAGNWKMNGLTADLVELEALQPVADEAGAEVLICPPATLLHRMAESAGPIAVGGQDCHPENSGAHTGDISAVMLHDAGATYVILGHSERRADHGESDKLVHDKVLAAWDAGLAAIVCVGETESQRDALETLDVIEKQLQSSIPEGATAARLVVAYEPVWAIGTGRTPTLEQVAEVHVFMRKELSDRFGAANADGIRLLYGGSVKPGNAAEIFAVEDVDGALVGGASLRAADFGPIIAALG